MANYQRDDMEYGKFDEQDTKQKYSVRSKLVDTSGNLIDSDNPLPVGITDPGGLPAEVDNSTHSLQTVDYSHHEIHSGSHYYIQGFLQLDDGDDFFVKMTTPDSAKWSHFLFNIKSTGICTSYLDEGAVGGMTGGVSMTPLNNNRNSTNTSNMIIVSNVTDSADYAVRLENDMWGADGFKENIGGGSGRDDELVLKRNTTYLRTFVSGADDNIIQFKASWYEHTDKD